MRELPKICNRIKQDLYNLYKYVQDSVPKLNNDLHEQKTTIHTTDWVGKYVNDSGVFGQSTSKSYIIPCSPNTSYLIEKNGGNRFVIAESSFKPSKDGDQLNLIWKDNSATSHEITTRADSNYITVYVESASQSVDTTVTITHKNMAKEIENFDKVNASLGGLSFEKDTNDNLIVTVSTGSKYEIAMTPQPQTQSLEDE